MTQTLLACGVCGAEVRDAYLCGSCTLDLAEAFDGASDRYRQLVGSMQAALAPVTMAYRADALAALGRAKELTAMFTGIDIGGRGGVFTAAREMAKVPEGPQVYGYMLYAVQSCALASLQELV